MSQSVFPRLHEPQLGKLQATMDRDGYGVLRGMLPTGFIPAMQNFVAEELAKRNNDYFCLFGQSPNAHSALDELGRSAAFRDVLARLYERGTGRPAPDSEMLQVLRVLTGEGGQKHSDRFHYDAYVVTALVPILIPPLDDEHRGDLVLFPNLRGIRSSALTNVVEKVVLQNPVAARVLKTQAVQRRFGARVVSMEPGNIYFFWGYRSLHANRPCRPDRVRSTALFHFADPHAQSPLVRFIENRHHRPKTAVPVHA